MKNTTKVLIAVAVGMVMVVSLFIGAVNQYNTDQTEIATLKKELNAERAKADDYKKEVASKKVIDTDLVTIELSEDTTDAGYYQIVINDKTEGSYIGTVGTEDKGTYKNMSVVNFIE